MAASHSLLRNTMKEKLARDEVVITMNVRLVRSAEIALIAATAGFDAVRVDLEHNSFSLDTTSQICIAALQAGLVPVARVPGVTAEMVARVLDGGALGITAPHIRSAAEARAIVEYVKYPPLGTRSTAGALPHFGFRSLPIAAMNEAMNAATMVTALIESADSLENVEEIAAVDGIDILSIGTNDLCADWGIPGQLEHKKVEDAYTRVIAACRRNGKCAGVGGLASKPDLMAKYVAAGARHITLAADLNLLLGAATQVAKLARSFKTN